MPEQFGDKKHDATPFRRQQAREQGQVVRSQDLASAILLVGALVILLTMGKSLAEFFGELMRENLGGQHWRAADEGFWVSWWHGILVQLAGVLLPILGLLLLVAVGSHLMQVGFLWLPDKLAIDFTRLDPLAAFGRLFEGGNLLRLAFGLCKFLIVTGVAVWSVWGQKNTVLGLATFTIPQLAAYIVEITLWTCLKIGLALLILAILDYGFQKWKYEQDLRMTDQELREEMKTQQGDPQITMRRRQVQRQLVLNRLGTTVPRAEVVVTNPTELAIALQYDPTRMEAPIVVAKGAGVLAQRIRRLALEHNIPIVERKELARLLYKEVDVGRPIPAAQYAAVAEILRYVYQLKGKPLPGMNAAA